MGGGQEEGGHTARNRLGTPNNFKSIHSLHGDVLEHPRVASRQLQWRRGGKNASFARPDHLTTEVRGAASHTQISEEQNATIGALWHRLKGNQTKVLQFFPLLNLQKISGRIEARLKTHKARRF